jgi:hypothetical protein
MIVFTKRGLQPKKNYCAKIFDLRKNVIGREGIPKQGRGDNVILAIKPL